MRARSSATASSPSSASAKGSRAPSTFPGQGAPRGRPRRQRSAASSRSAGPASVSRAAAAPPQPTSRVARMGERTRYAPGTFSWADVSTTDRPGAKEFYVGLFGWAADDRPVGDGVVYSMMHEDGNDVAAISPQPQQQRDAGVPPLWNSYITVESADDSAAKAKEL